LTHCCRHCHRHRRRWVRSPAVVTPSLVLELLRALLIELVRHWSVLAERSGL